MSRRTSLLGSPPVAALAFVLALGAAAPCGAAEASPYAGEQERPIKALSAEQIATYLAGEGMGLALAAELNGHPGPKHVLELAEELELSPAQRAAVEAIFAGMQAEARRLGGEIVGLERRLDGLFSAPPPAADAVRAILDEIALRQAALRFAHLAAHLETDRVLAPEQVAAYQRLRGYDGGHEHPRDGHREGGHRDHRHGGHGPAPAVSEGR